ncbi:MAG: polysaccharide deacetylase family protein [Candidatus Omnitrophica bacterium]|nr:polysaccharide deacetylase family protein [Candidatus Omnitrophota bacterium]
MKKPSSRFLLSFVVIVCVVLVGFTFWIRDRYVVPILTYHHVGEYSDKVLALNTVSTKSFEFQMDFLRRHGYLVISFDDLVEGIKKGYAFSRNTVVIHFDDGYEDNYSNAFPILKKYQLPAMVFVVSDKVGTSGFLTWDQMKEMEQNNFLIGSHTRHHVYLPKVSLEKARDEIEGSKKILERNLGHSIDYFVYPTGGFSLEDKEIVKKAGYKAAGTTNRGKDKFNHDLYELKRIRMNEGDDQFSGIIMWAKLSGYYNLFRQSKSGGVSRDMILK